MTSDGGHVDAQSFICDQAPRFGNPGVIKFDRCSFVIPHGQQSPVVEIGGGGSEGGRLGGAQQFGKA